MPNFPRDLFLAASLTALCLSGLSGCAIHQEEQSAAAQEKQPAATEQEKGPDDSPQAGGPAAAAQQPARTANRLAKETSPYLLLHAHNPVDWYPWGEEALNKAKRENKMIFLSVGYSSCHWCHVMERESFMDEEIARFLNDHFVCIKVDREERPDVDKIYMTALNSLGNNGGWPMSMFLTPDAKPVWGGTYFPARDGDRGQATGFLSILQALEKTWKAKEKELREVGDKLAEHTKEYLERQTRVIPVELNEKLMSEAVAALAQQYDEQYGGFAPDLNRPKFPEPSNLYFLLHRHQAAGDEKAKELAVGTLTRMAMGGIRDHLGGGFHRYSVDRYWRIPHFEKMLYDNAQLASLYAQAYTITHREEFRRIVDEMLQFVLREMTDKQGGFYSALDAESEHEEGKFYRWDKDEAERLLQPDEYQLFAAIYGLDQPPNFEKKYYAPQLSRTMEEHAAERKMTVEQLQAQLQPIREKLLAARSQRPRPLTDDKILTSWNGLMIRGFADAGRLLKNKAYIESAEQAAQFVLHNMRDPQGRLLRTYSQGKDRLNAYLNDYAFLIDGLIALHRATHEEKWLKAADELMALQIELFADEQFGGFFFTSNNHESLLARAKNPIDGAQPSGNSVSAENLIYLAQATSNPKYRKRAEDTIQTIARFLQDNPVIAPRMVVAASEYLATQPRLKEERLKEGQGETR